MKAFNQGCLLLANMIACVYYKILLFFFQDNVQPFLIEFVTLLLDIIEKVSSSHCTYKSYVYHYNYVHCIVHCAYTCVVL